MPSRARQAPRLWEVARAAQGGRVGAIPGITQTRAASPARVVRPARRRPLRLRARLAGALELFAGMPRDVKGILALIGLVAVLGTLRLIFAGNPDPIVPLLGFSEPLSATPSPAVIPTTVPAHRR
jgi:hypothetical protein